MAGGSTSQASQLVARGGRNSSGAPTGTAGALRRRPVRSGGSGSSKQSSVNYYTDDTPGLKISPVVVIGMSIGFILFVTVLHIVGKIRGLASPSA